MTFGERVFLYCERGTDEALWAEPINAISNAGFLLAALIAWQLLLWRPREMRSADHFLLIGLVFLIGFGSLAFHLYADQGTALADVVPIVLFMLVYLGFALNRFLGVPPGFTVLAAVGFAGLIGLAMQVQCWDGGIGIVAPEGAEAKPCLNGSVAYLPALAALILVGMLLAERHHRAAPYVVWAAVVFTISVIFRSVDVSLCDQVVIDGRQVGTHFIWHLLNALTLFLLLRASFEAGPVAVHSIPAAAPEAEPAPVEALPAKDALKESPQVASAGEEAALKVTADAAKNDGPESETAVPEPKHEAPKTGAAPEEPGAETEAGASGPETPAAGAESAKEETEPLKEGSPGDEAPPTGRAKKKPFFPA